MFMNTDTELSFSIPYIFSLSLHYPLSFPRTFLPPPSAFLLLQPLPFLWGDLQPFHSYSAPNVPQLFLIVMDAFICRKDIPDSGMVISMSLPLYFPRAPLFATVPESSINSWNSWFIFNLRKINTCYYTNIHRTYIHGEVFQESHVIWLLHYNVIGLLLGC
jgi:hypothetical protein